MFAPKSSGFFHGEQVWYDGAQGLGCFDNFADTDKCLLCFPKQLSTSTSDHPLTGNDLGHHWSPAKKACPTPLVQRQNWFLRTEEVLRRY
ncbi:hypothetical protein VTK56DRAFT_7483 [Thermocarpiscus australiensis]